MNIKKSVSELVGHTPLLDLSRTAAAQGVKARLLGKLESCNPTGSVKDRVALNMINRAEAEGLLKPGSVIIEPTSGNTGIGLAAIAAERGYEIILTMPETMSIERRNLLKAYGAKLVLTDGARGMKGAIEKAEELLVSTPDSFMPAQFDNPHNPQTHFESTGPEIYADTDGQIDILVAGVGTGGTLTGIGRYLKEKKPSVKIVAVEPLSSPVLSGGAAGAHKLQGIGAGFIPTVLDMKLIDEIIPVDNEDAFKQGRVFGPTEGLLVGISSGAALYAAVLLGRRPENIGKTIVVILPDTGDRYLSTAMFQ